MSREWVYTINAPDKWLNSNDRPKRRPNATIAAWRGLSSALAQYCKVPQIEACRITATLCWADNVRRDAGNYYPTIKAAIDGLKDAGVLEDDDDRHVLSLTIERGPNVAKRKLGVQGQLTLTIREADLARPENAPAERLAMGSQPAEHAGQLDLLDLLDRSEAMS